jgi:hypothetical protein
MEPRTRQSLESQIYEQYLTASERKAAAKRGQWYTASLLVGWGLAVYGAVSAVLHFVPGGW